MQYVALEETVYLWFGVNDTAGSGADGATPLFDVREGGAAAGAIPTLSGTPTLLTHANYPAGCHEIAIAATAANGFAANKSYGVFCTLLVDSQNPTGFVGAFRTTAIASAAELVKVPKSDSNVTFNATALASINAEVVDALGTDTYAEPGQGAPAATATLATKLGYLYKAWRNRHTQTAAEYALYADDTTTKDQEAVVSDDGTTFERGEVGTGA